MDAMPKVDLARRLEIEDRQAQVLTLRLKNVTYDEIAALFGVSKMTIVRDYRAALARHRDNSLAIAGEVKAQNKARLEDLIERQLARVEKDSDAEGRLMRAIDLLNKMYGVYGSDAPNGAQGSAPPQGLTITFTQNNITVSKERAADAPMLMYGDSAQDADSSEDDSAEDGSDAD